MKSSCGAIARELIRQLTAVKAVTSVVTTTIGRMEQGEEVDVSALLLQSAAARERANRFLDAMYLRQQGARASGAAESAALRIRDDSDARVVSLPLAASVSRRRAASQISQNHPATAVLTGRRSTKATPLSTGASPTRAQIHS